MSEQPTKQKLSEEDVKRLYITPAIEARWDAHSQIKMEYSFTDGRVIVRGDVVSRGSRKKADYVLFYKSNIPLAVVEAKSNTSSFGAGMQQAIAYAEVLDVPFAYCSNGEAFLEHDMVRGTERELPIEGFPSPEELWSRYIEAKQFTDEQATIVAEPYFFQQGGKVPRYYQSVAINRTIEAVARGQKRILLVMATGTGKTYTAFQIVHRLLKSGTKKRILYLADRNVLVDQTIKHDFKPLDKVKTKIVGRHMDSAYELYFSLYQQLAGDENSEPFREFQPTFFDLIIVDECHRGSASEESLWRKILEYFSGATHIGMTATPKETKDISSTGYFGDPLYTYSLKQGIDDGFLAPYKVVRVGLDVDLEGWRPTAGMLDVHGNEIEDREYNLRDYDRSLIIDQRTLLVAKRISDYLRRIGRFQKTIVFCVDTEHAERMRQALVNENSDLVAEDHRYVVRITGNDETGMAQLDNFLSDDSRYPVIATTSQLLSTGVDCVMCALIVLERNIGSMTEFKQVIGRGTRLNEEAGKLYFTIIDFRGVSRLFADPAFDGDPISIIESCPGGHNHPEPPPQPPPCCYPPYEPVQYRVNDVDVTIINERVQFYDVDGKLVTESIVDYSKRNILGKYATLDDFLAEWNSSARKQAILDELKERGVLLGALRSASGDRDIDDFDLILHIAFDKAPLSRSERVARVRKGDYLSQYEGVAREVLSALLDKYSANGVADLEDINVLRIDPFRTMAELTGIIGAFGGRDKYLAAVRHLQERIYVA